MLGLFLPIILLFILMFVVLRYQFSLAKKGKAGMTVMELSEKSLQLSEELVKEHKETNRLLKEFLDRFQERRSNFKQ